jgi:hypothetical protein
MKNRREREEEDMRESKRLAGLDSVVEIICECGRSGCAEVIALPRCVYERALREPRRLLLAPGHELPGIGRALSRYDSFVVVTKERSKATGIAEND